MKSIISEHLEKEVLTRCWHVLKSKSQLIKQTSFFGRGYWKQWKRTFLRCLFHTRQYKIQKQISYNPYPNPVDFFLIQIWHRRLLRLMELISVVSKLHTWDSKVLISLSKSSCCHLKEKPLVGWIGRCRRHGAYGLQKHLWQSVS